MKKRYMPSILIAICLLIATCVGIVYAKYASEKKAENVFILSSDVQLKTYTYAIWDKDTNKLSIRSRQATVGGGQLIEVNGGSYNLTQVYNLDPNGVFGFNNPNGATSWPTYIKNDLFKSITSITVEDDIQLNSANVTWFKNFTVCTELNLAKLTLPSNTTLTSSYFTGSTALTNVVLPKNVTKIDDECFEDRTTLVSVTLPDGVKSIGKRAFSSCTALTTVELGTGLETVGNNAFFGCTKLTEVNLGVNVKTIGDSAFYSCTALTEVDLEGNTKLTTIGEYAFQNCVSLNNISLPDTITEMKKWCFGGCISLTVVHIPQNLKGFSEGLFSGCVNLTVDTEKLIPDSVTYVNGDAFKNCSSITADVILTEKITLVGSSAFRDCSSITEITIRENMKGSIGGYAFAGTGIKEIDVYDKCFYSDKMPGYLFYNCKDLTTVTIGNGVKTIGNNVFDGCTSLTTITIPDSVTTIENQAFGGRDDVSPCVIFYNGTAAGPANDNPATEDVEENWGNVIVVNSENLDGVPTCTLNGDASSMNITLPAGVVTEQLRIRIGQNTADGFVSYRIERVTKNEYGTFDIPVADVTQMLITLSIPEKVQYAAYSDSTKTLYFLNDILIDAGETIPGTDDTATAVYTDILGSEWFGPGNAWIESYAANIETVRFLGNIAPISMSNWFDGCTSLKAIYGMAEHLNTSNVLFMDSAFKNCSQLTELDLNGFDTAYVQDMSGMFYDCSSLVTIYASEMFVTSGLLEDSQSLFKGCTSLVGGGGTAFSSTKTDDTYARIDGKDGQPGYFTGISELLIVTDDDQLADAIAANTDYIVESGTYSGTVSAAAVNVTINNAVFKDVTKANAMAVSGGGTLVVNYVDDTDNPDRASIAAIYDGILTIESGKFAAQTIATGNSSGTVIIKGGTFTVSYINGLMGFLYRVGTIEIYGGTFNVNPSEYVADGYTAVDNGNGTWTVQ